MLEKIQRITYFNSFHPQASSSPTRALKIATGKLPDDFFLRKSLNHSMNASFLSRRTELQTGSHLRNGIQTARTPLTPLQFPKTAAQEADQVDQLIMGVISSSRQMKRVLRKHSLDVRKNSLTDKLEKHAKLQGYRVELPPLIMRKGRSAKF